MTTTTIDGLPPPAKTAALSSTRPPTRPPNAMPWPRQGPQAQRQPPAPTATAPDVGTGAVTDAGYGRPPVVSARLFVAAMWVQFGAALVNAALTW